MVRQWAIAGHIRFSGAHSCPETGWPRGLYLSGRATAQDLPEIKRLGIRRVVNCSPQTAKYWTETFASENKSSNDEKAELASSLASLRRPVTHLYGCRPVYLQLTQFERRCR